MNGDLRRRIDLLYWGLQEIPVQVKISAFKVTRGVKHIADDLFALRRATRGARSDARLERAGLKRVSADLDALTDALKGADLYAFSRSAMNAAGDLRIDTPRRLEGVIAAVTREPRRIWLEADPRDLDLVLGSLRGVSAVTPRDVSPRHGWGVLAALDGRGRGQMTILLRERTEAALAAHRRLRSLPGAHAEALSGAADIRLLCCVDIDANRSSGVSREEFDRAFLKIGAAGDPLLAASEAAIADASGVRERNRILDGAWSLSRLRSVARHQGEPGDQIAGPRPARRRRWIPPCGSSRSTSPIVRSRRSTAAVGVGALTLRKTPPTLMTITEPGLCAIL